MGSIILLQIPVGLRAGIKGVGDPRRWPEGYSCIVDPVRIELPLFRDLHAYWDGKRGGRRMPARADIDPLELRAHLGSLVLIEPMPAADDFRYRLIGTKVTRQHGRDSTGKTVRELYGDRDPVIFDWTMTVLRAVVDQRVPVAASNRLRMVRKEFIASEQLLLPLSNDGTSVNMILCEVAFTDLSPPE
jgi:hypothetical protein